MNLAVNKKTIRQRRSGREKARRHPSPTITIRSTKATARTGDPAVRSRPSKKLLAEAGHAGGFEVRVNPMVMAYALDGPDIMEAVVLDWERIGIKSKRFPGRRPARSARRAEIERRGRPTGCMVAAVRRAGPRLESDHSLQGRVQPRCRGPFDEDIDTIMKEFDVEKRGSKPTTSARKLYDGYYGVMIGIKSVTWALSKKVGRWQTLAYVPIETNYEYASPAS